jgi:triacylglycerol esterase/lipase EstA (alpha/beta hydrolase family)
MAHHLAHSHHSHRPHDAPRPHHAHRRHPRHLVVLCPGFFGFHQIGPLAYFKRVEKPLEHKLRALGLDPHLFVARPDPAGTTTARAQDVLDQAYARFAGGSFEKIHFYGHSMGAIDVRLALDPHEYLGGGRERTAQNAKKRAFLRASQGARISIAAPHWGTPFAVPFLLAGFGVLERRLPLTARLIVTAVKKGVASDELFGVFLQELGFPVEEIEGWVAQIKLLGLSIRDVQKTLEFVLSVVADRRAIGDLTPLACSRRNARQKDLGADTPHCHSILTRAPRPDPTALARASGDLAVVPTYLVYSALWAITAFFPSPRHFHHLPRATLDRLHIPWADRPDERDNDGIVPTLSQPWGRVEAILCADHEDVIGHLDWVSSGAGFNEHKLHKMLDVVADCIVNV